ncbi:hypothetical protein AB6A40_004726 [Gnathostoma spinigerum]|uniref:GOST seven transmembrane domain-containing protein n=1 Tax=Gnathostoma spinigerum TaxID=75299 RepID=A0ABD6EMT6_9BILA
MKICSSTPALGYVFILFLSLASLEKAGAKIHHLKLQGDTRRNILLTSFGYDAGGTFELLLENFTMPDAVVNLNGGRESRRTERFGLIGFTLSKGKTVVDGIRTKPHVCQLVQTDQGYDALFFQFDFAKERLDIFRSGSVKSLHLCKDLGSCPYEQLGPFGQVHNATTEVPSEQGGLFDRVKNMFRSDEDPMAYKDYIPLKLTDNQFSTSLAIRFNEYQRGKYHFIYHNCFNYREHGYSDRVAVDFTVSIDERNVGSFLSAGEIAKPKLFLSMSALFFLLSFIWVYKLCHSSRQTIYRVHHLMTALVIIKALSLFFHGINFYFVSKYGRQREVWAVVFYITHLLKGALLFGTIILIGTGYTLFKNFLTERDRKLIMIVLPLQVIDNVAMIIIEESEFGQQSYQFWFQLFIFFDIVCCMAILLPIIWSMRHLQQGARSDGKAAFNLEKLKLFRHFYLIIIGYIYLTRVIKFLIEFVVPFNYEWITDAVVEFSTFFFFILSGHAFRPTEQNPYLKLEQDEDAEAITQNGIYANISRVNRVSVRDETVDDIPGAIGGNVSSGSDDDEDLFQDTDQRPLVKKSSVS